MPLPRTPLGRPLVGFVCLVLVYQLVVITACPESDFGQLLDELCLTKFKLEMEEIEKKFWCDWGQTFKSYREVTNCTYLIAEKLDCYWPNYQVNDFFLAIHRHYFQDCPATGRVLKDPPSNVLCPFIIAPILVTLLGTALVVYKSQRNEGIV
ncbi:receptor activity-modifying protein 1 [Dromiciops gliroides]|uniref:receptor activity-modifying protein 1 n=1 Tax=Dromiciops gliroides TaxID=33562 RepID=UPI001CC3B189|nr:receptor activity-modifying protein 1 [Dromiciops gliroides]